MFFPHGFLIMAIVGGCFVGWEVCGSLSNQFCIPIILVISNSSLPLVFVCLCNRNKFSLFEIFIFSLDFLELVAAGYRSVCYVVCGGGSLWWVSWVGGSRRGEGGILNICLSSTHRESTSKHKFSCISCAKKIGGEVSHRKFLHYVWFWGNMHVKMLNLPKN